MSAAETGFAPENGLALGKRRSLPEELAAIILRRVESGEFRPGDVLPSEQALSETYQVSRTVVREALARLKYEGIVESKRGSGPIVKGTSPERGFTLNLEDMSRSEWRHFMEFRIILEGEAAALAALRRSPAQLTELARHLEGIRRAPDENTSGTEPDYLFHQCIADAAGNTNLADFIKFMSAKIWLGVHRARWKSNQARDLSDAVFAEHRETFAAIEAGDPHRARAAAQRHLLNSAARQGVTMDTAFLAGNQGGAVSVGNAQ